MTVYVDELQPCKPNPRWRWKQAAHLASPDLKELHAFALRIGLKRLWFQRHSTPHYDLTQGMRRRALAAGAVPVSSCDLVSRCRSDFQIKYCPDCDGYKITYRGDDVDDTYETVLDAFEVMLALEADALT